MSDEKRKFYAGVRQDCGCHTALLVDDDKTTAKDVARFAADMAKSKRVVRHVELTHDEYMTTFRACPHMTPNAALSGCEPMPDQEAHGLSSQSARTHS